MKRKKFIVNTSLAAISPFVLDFLSACKSVSAKERSPIFIFIQLTGGNDGLNTLIPLNDYSKIVEARPNLYIPEKKILPLNNTSNNGLHPSMKAVQEMYNNNLITFVQGVGYENPSYSHFRSSDIYLTGSSATEVIHTGWMARYLKTVYNNYPYGFPSALHPEPPAIKVGDTGTYLFQGEELDMSLVIDPASEFVAPDVENNNSKNESLAAIEVATIRKMLLQTKSYSSVIENALSVPFNHSKLYPKTGTNSLADQLKLVARFINSGIKTPVYMVELKGFDTHDNQVDPNDTAKGPHSDLLAKLSEAVACFWDDIVKMGREDTVAGMTFSEFGRRIMSNASYGTDHGSAQAIMLFGKNMKQGIVGKNPVIPQNLTVDNNLEVEFDFKSVYSTVLQGWFKSGKMIADKVIGQQPYIDLFSI